MEVITLVNSNHLFIGNDIDNLFCCISHITTNKKRRLQLDIQGNEGIPSRRLTRRP